MKIDVKRIAKLANLTLSASEEKEFDEQLNDILSYVEQLNKVDTENVEPTAQVTGLKNVTRNDKFTDDMLSQDEALSGTDKPARQSPNGSSRMAGGKHNGLFVVDKLVDTDS